MHLNYLPLQAHIVLLNSKYHAHFSFPTYYIYIYFFFLLTIFVAYTPPACSDPSAILAILVVKLKLLFP